MLSLRDNYRMRHMNSNHNQETTMAMAIATTNTRPEIIIAASATLHGIGSDPWKWVSGLTSDERDAVDRGDLVVVLSNDRHRTYAGHPPFRIVVRYGRKFYHRVPRRRDRRRIEIALCLLRRRAYVEIRRQSRRGASSGSYGGPDTYVAVQIVPEGAERLKILRRDLMKKRAIFWLYAGEGYSTNKKTSRSSLRRAIDAAQQFAEAINGSAERIS